MSKSSTDTKLHAFREWLSANGGYIHPNAELVYSESLGVHLLAKIIADQVRPIYPGSPVVTVPHTLSLSALNTIPQLTAFPSHISSTSTSQPPHIPVTLLGDVPRAQSLAAVWLCLHQRFGSDSFWAPYIDALPSLPTVDDADGMAQQGLGEIDSPLGWGAAEKTWVSGSPLEKGTADLEKMWYTEWTQWGVHAAAWAENLGVRIDWPQYKWALTILTSRAFSSAILDHVPHGDHRLTDLFNPDALLYPGMDMLNHSPTTKNRWEYNQYGFTLVCNDEVHAGDEIFNTYGAKNNGQLMLCYAFTIPGNPYDAFPLKVPPANSELGTFVEQRNFNPSHSASSDVFVQGGKTANKPAVIADPHDPARTTFYVRDPRITIPKPGYPAVASCFAPFPDALLNRLSSTLASRREQQWASEHADTFRSSPIATLHTHLGSRNTLALASLLLDRLRFEAARLDAALSRIPPAAEAQTTRHSRLRKTRRVLARTYMSDLHGLLRAAEAHMRTLLRRNLTAHPAVFMNLHAALAGLPAAILASLGAGLGADLTSGEPDTLRRAVVAWTAAGLAEDVWAVYVGVLSGAAGIGVALGQTSEQHAVWLAQLVPQIPAATDLDAEMGDVVGHFRTFLAEGKSRTKNAFANKPGDVWSEDYWTSEVVERCCWIVQSETVSMPCVIAPAHGELASSTDDVRDVVLVVDAAFSGDNAFSLGSSTSF